MTLPEYSPAVYALLRAFQADGHHQLSTQDEKSTKRFLREEKLLHDYFEPYGYRLTAKGIEALRQEDVRLAAAEQAAEDHAREQAQQAEKDSSDRAQVLSDKKKDYRHDFAVAAFGAAVTLFVEHIGDIIDFSKVTVEKVLLLLGLLH